MSHVITLDGPSGSGKGTLSRLLANTMQYSLLDSGAIYRVCALAALNKHIGLDDEAALSILAQELDLRFDVEGEETLTLLDGDDVSRLIREENVGMAASQIASLSTVRDGLLLRQRNFSVESGLVADGRDMGTVVFPDAQHKFYLTASAQERARRRVQQLQESGEKNLDEQKILMDIQARDERDMNRAVAPLKPAEDAIEIDSTLLSIEAVLQRILKHIRS